MFDESENFPQLEKFLSENYGLVEKFDKAEVWKLLGPRVRALLMQ